VTRPATKSGYFRRCLPCNRAGHAPRPLLVCPGLTFENEPRFGMLGMYGFLLEEYTLFAVQRRPGMPAGYSLRDMANDYATVIRTVYPQKGLRMWLA